jgi:hypothetical protein
VSFVQCGDKVSVLVKLIFLKASVSLLLGAATGLPQAHNRLDPGQESLGRGAAPGSTCPGDPASRRGCAEGISREPLLG